MATKKSAPEIPVLPNVQAVDEAIAEIGRRQRERERIQTRMNDEIANIRQAYEGEAAPHGDAIKQLMLAVEAYCQANRAELTAFGNVKTAELASGSVSWRKRPPRVNVRGEEAVLDTLRRQGLVRFIRTKEELNKEAILLDPEAVAGIKGLNVVDNVEDFIVTPFATKLEEIR